MQKLIPILAYCCLNKCNCFQLCHLRKKKAYWHYKPALGISMSCCDTEMLAALYEHSQLKIIVTYNSFHFYS